MSKNILDSLINQTVETTGKTKGVGWILGILQFLILDENIIDRAKSMSFLLYAKIYPKYDSNDFPGIVNLELGWKISKIIFRLNYGSFTKTQHSLYCQLNKKKVEKFSEFNLCMCLVRFVHLSRARCTGKSHRSRPG